MLQLLSHCLLGDFAGGWPAIGRRSRIAHILQGSQQSCSDKSCLAILCFYKQTVLLIVGGIVAQCAILALKILALAPKLSSPREIPQDDCTRPQTILAQLIT